MPMRKSASKAATDENFHEFKHGETYRRTKKKFGEKVAHKQLVAAVLANKRKSKKTARKRG
jgi:hypothetical protein